MQQKWCDLRHTCHWQSLIITILNDYQGHVPSPCVCTRDLRVARVAPFLFRVNNIFLILPTIPSRLHFSNPDGSTYSHSHNASFAYEIASPYLNWTHSYSHPPFFSRRSATAPIPIHTAVSSSILPPRSPIHMYYRVPVASLLIYALFSFSSCSPAPISNLMSNRSLRHALVYLDLILFVKVVHRRVV